METTSSSDAIDSSLSFSRRPTETGIDNTDENRPNISVLKARFYELYGEYYSLKGSITLWKGADFTGLLQEGKNTINAIISDLNIHDFMKTIPYFDQKRVVSEDSLARADKELNILEGINSRIRRKLEELEQLGSYSI